MQIEANGETRKAIAVAVVTALFVAFATEAGKWAIEEIRSRTKKPPPKSDE